MTKEQLEALKKITPGPWDFETDDIGDETFLVVPIEIVGADGFKVVSYEGGLAPNSEWTKELLFANAIAIAALPDLIAERERMIALLKNLRAVTEIYGWALAHSEELTNQALKQMELKGIGSRGVEADALIAEAEGGE